MKTLIKILCLSMLWFSCESSTEPQEINGCIDEAACNFNPDANISNNSCIYSELNYDCDGNCTAEVDCLSICGGDAIIDECEICGGNGTDNDNDGICDDIDDCVGEYDECGICNGGGLDEDNDGICDDMDDCVGEYDECGICNGNGFNECGMCGDDGISCNEDSVLILCQCYLIESTIELDLSNTALTDLPENIGNLINLERLDLENNNLVSLPESIGNLSSLLYLNLKSNQLASLPESICDLPENCYITLWFNNLCPEYNYDCVSPLQYQDCDE